MLNYQVDPDVLRPLVPRGTELDHFDGRTFVSMVGFRFLDTRVMGISVPWHRDFDEVNLRFYVRARGPEGWRRGVVFVKEIVPKRLVSWVARVAYNEKYVTLPMDHRVELPGEVEYRWRFRGEWCRLAARTVGEPVLRPDESEEAFITEHYWGYSTQRDGGTVEYRVDHPRWRVWSCEAATFKCDVAGLYGPAFVQALTAPPSSAFVAEGSPVVVRRGRRR